MVPSNKLYIKIKATNDYRNVQKELIDLGVSFRVADKCFERFITYKPRVESLFFVILVNTLEDENLIRLILNNEIINETTFNSRKEQI